ncbi:unnamed protein product [Leuciscus chuanchicus]
MAVVSHVNRQGGSRSRTLDRHAHHLLLWSQDKFLSLRAVHVPGILNLAADFLSRQKLRSDVEPPDGGPDLGDVRESGSGPLFISGVIPMPALVLPEPSSSVGDRCIRPPMADAETLCLPAHQADPGGSVQSEGERSPPPSGSPILAVPAMVFGADPSVGILPLGDPGQGGPAFPASGQDMASSPRHLEAVRLAYQRPLALSFDLPTDVQETIASARAPSTRKLYSSKWRVFKAWFLAHDRNPGMLPPSEYTLQLLSFIENRTRFPWRVMLNFAPGLVKVTLRPRLGSLRRLEEIKPALGMFWCWPPRACRIKTEDFPLGFGRYFAGLRDLMEVKEESEELSEVEEESEELSEVKEESEELSEVTEESEELSEVEEDGEELSEVEEKHHVKPGEKPLTEDTHEDPCSGETTSLQPEITECCFGTQHLSQLVGVSSSPSLVTEVSRIPAVSRSDGGPAPGSIHDASLKCQPHQPCEGLIDTTNLTSDL